MSDYTGPITVNKIRLVLFTLPITALCVAIIRLVERARKRKLWWDDALAGLCAIMLLIFIVTTSLFTNPAAMLSMPQSTRISIYYMEDQFYYATIWTARFSLLFTIIRLRPRGFLAYIVKGLVPAFAVTWLIMLAQAFWVCERQPDWKQAPVPQCVLGKDVAIAQVITSVLVDFILIVIPVKMIWTVKIKRAQRIRLICVFFSTAALTIASLYHAITLLRVGGLPEALAAVIETSISVYVANSTVIVAMLFRLKSEETDQGKTLPNTMYLSSRSPNGTYTSPNVLVTHETIRDFDTIPISKGNDWSSGAHDDAKVTYTIHGLGPNDSDDGKLPTHY